MLKLARPTIKIIATEPEVAALMKGDEWHPHKIQGWTPDFLPEVFDTSVADQVVRVSDDEAINTSQALASKEGIFCGISAGGTVAAALKVAEIAEPGSSILAMLPDTAERYLTTPLFEGISEGSDDDIWSV
jgi:cysteine synthase A